MFDRRRNLKKTYLIYLNIAAFVILESDKFFIVFEKTPNECFHRVHLTLELNSIQHHMVAAKWHFFGFTNDQRLELVFVIAEHISILSSFKGEM